MLRKENDGTIYEGCGKHACSGACVWFINAYFEGCTDIYPKEYRNTERKGQDSSRNWNCNIENNGNLTILSFFSHIWITIIEMQIHGREEYPSSQILFSQTELVRRNDFVSVPFLRIPFRFARFSFRFPRNWSLIIRKEKSARYPTSVRPFCRASRHVRAFMKSADKSIRDGELVPTRGICIL